MPPRTRFGRVSRLWVMLVLLCFLIRVARPALSLHAGIAEAGLAHSHVAFLCTPVHSAAAIAIFLDGVIASAAVLPNSTVQLLGRGTVAAAQYSSPGSLTHELSQLRI